MVMIPHFVQLELDESDTELRKRISAFNFCDPFDHVLPFSDGIIGKRDRHHLWGMYVGVVDVPPPEVDDSFPYPIWRRRGRRGR